MNRKRSSWGWWIAQGLVAALVLVVAAQSYQRYRTGGPTPSAATLPGRKETSRGGGALLRPGAGLPHGSAGEPTSASVTATPSGLSRPSESSLRGSPYSPERFREPRKTRSGDDPYEIWELDAQELAWLLANQEEVLTRELSAVPNSTGGLRVAGLRQGSFAASRGIRQDDVIRDINGKNLDGPSDVQDMAYDPAHSSSKGWRILLEREGRLFTLDYRGASPHPLTHREH